MAAWGARQAYPAVVTTMVVLVSLFTVAALLRPLIPPRETNPVASRPGDYMLGAARQRVNWRTLSDQPFAEAKRLDRPVVLVVGSQWSAAARYVDRAILADDEVAERLNHSFVPVRIDGMLDPEWSFGPVPIAIAQARSDPGWFIAVFQPDGKPLNWISQSTFELKLDSRTLQSMLTEAQRQMHSSGRSGNSSIVDRAQVEHEFLMGLMPGGGGDLATYTGALKDRLAKDQLLAENDVKRLYPWEWRFLLAQGLVDDVHRYLGKIATSNAVDWLEGGFFRAYGPGTVRYDKLSVENADFLVALTEIGIVTGDQYLQMLAKRAFDSVLDQFVVDGKVYAWSSRDSVVLGRSERHSLRPSLVSRRFDPDDAKFLHDFLGIDAGKDPTMLPHVVDPTDYVKRPEHYHEILERWNKLTDNTQPQRGGASLATVECSFYARLTECARLLNDEPRLKRLDDLFKGTLRYRTGPEDVLHTLSPDIQSVAYLGDYVSFADACLQRYLTVGDPQVLAQGQAVLKRAESIFQTLTPGILGLVPTERVPRDVPWIQYPNLIDGHRASVTGALIRVVQAYSCLLRDRADGQDMRRLVLTQVSQCAKLTTEMDIRLGALAFAMTSAVSDRYVVVTGPEATKQATALAAVNPNVMVFPAVGSVRKDLQRKTGVVVVVQGNMQGPMDPESAKELLTTLP